MTVNRAELKRQYKQAEKEAGIFQIKNTVNGKVFLASTKNLHGPLNRHRFMLDLGTHGNAKLQLEWKQHGAAAFVIEVVAKVEVRDDPDFALEDELERLEQVWVAKVQPFGERGYNKTAKIRD